MWQPHPSEIRAFRRKKAMNIRGLSEATLDQLIRLGALKSYQDLYHLDRYRDEIIALEGFGEKSYENLIASINESRSTTFVRFVVAKVCFAALGHSPDRQDCQQDTGQTFTRQPAGAEAG